MKDSDIEKIDSSNPDDILAAITSFNDPAIITNIFRDLGWNYSMEIKETLALARQNANLSIKFKAIKYLRGLIREAAEAAGYTASVSQTIPNAQGGITTFHAKRMAGILNPAKKIESTEIKETQNGKKELQSLESSSRCDEETRTEPNRGSNREQNQTKTRIPRGANSPALGTGTDTGRAFPIGDAESGGTESQDGGETPRPVPGGIDSSDNNAGEGDTNPCIKTRPPTCDQDLFKGISTSAGD